LQLQRDESESLKIYTALAKKEKNKINKKLLDKIAADEKRHYTMLKSITWKDIKSRSWRVFIYLMISKVFGLTFGLKLMELREVDAQVNYKKLHKKYPELLKILEDEEKHEKELIDMLEEAKLWYMGSVVLGLNDALVELTWALAGFAFAIQNSRSIALIGLITGISASLSMAASEFLSKRQEDGDDTKEALISSAYTWCAYIGTVIFLIAPYFLISNPFYALWATLMIALVIIALFNFYISVAKDYNFKKRFSEMALISLWVALISFCIGWFVKTFLWLDI
jgi:VIT1/CCC1 family predicted Fe2+/Mn2+ transporter